MPAIPLIIQVILGALFTPTILKGFGINLNPDDVQNGFATAPHYVQVPPGTPGAVPEKADTPTSAEIAHDAVKNPISLFGIAAIGFVSVFVISQLRAAAAETTDTGRGLIRGGQRFTDSLANADGGTVNLTKVMRRK